MSNTLEFKGFPKIPRLKRGCIITEKIDGSNAQIVITDEGQFYVGSRNQWITPEKDNYGFAKWAFENKDQLMELGPGQHFGEWWGNGIQRNYGLKEKRFSLFNTGRWSNWAQRPKCCSVVPVLFAGEFETTVVDKTLNKLKETGSMAEPGWMKPEGIIVFLPAANAMYKVTCEKDEQHKGFVES